MLPKSQQKLDAAISIGADYREVIALWGLSSNSRTQCLSATAGGPLAPGLGEALGAGAGVLGLGALRFGAGRGAGGRVELDPELGGFQAADLVAQAGGLLELEIAGGVLHPGLEVADVALQAQAGQRLGRVRADVDRDVVARSDVAEDVADLLS